jgi:hypothetical protein
VQIASNLLERHLGALLVVVSNRLPLMVRKSNQVTKMPARNVARFWRTGPKTSAASRLSCPLMSRKKFYEGYTNQTLWPVFHSFPSQLRFDATSWDAYVEANRISCKAVVERFQPGDLAWVHDYHLFGLEIHRGRFGPTRVHKTFHLIVCGVGVLPFGQLGIR